MTSKPLLPLNWKYSFDTSAFIDSWRRYYPKDVFQNLWAIIEEKLKNEVIVSTTLVKDEIDYQEDDLKEFLDKFPKNFIVPDKQTHKHVSEIINDADFDKWSTEKVK